MDQSNPLAKSKLYQLLTWKNKMHTAVALVLVNLFFYFYIILGNSLINLATRVILVYFLYKIFVPSGKKIAKDELSKD